MTASEYQSQMVPFAMELANRISLRLEHHNSLTSFEIEDIEQELLTYVLERASQFDPAIPLFDLLAERSAGNVNTTFTS